MVLLWMLYHNQKHPTQKRQHNQMRLTMTNCFPTFFTTLNGILPALVATFKDSKSLLFQIIYRKSLTFQVQ